ncbi:MAG: MotA/TolQ/ExbB proton channel family protein [Candidatus Hydrogenedentes bacterium]|jgi:biopolymer transport protein ExbB|nr:MotA/TolQ/ExbB proton channel family protein [Candidatus Hydrogenedentota bacterium]
MMKKLIWSLLLVAAVAAPCFAQDSAAVADPDSPAVMAVSEHITLRMMIEQGGAILWVIMGLGFVAIVLALYLLFTVRSHREIPPALMKRAVAQVKAGEIQGAYHMCLERDEILARVLAAGLKMRGHSRSVIQEAMESEGERSAAALWQRISYLNNIGTTAPLLGLLGTVWGMMNAFGAIAFDPAQVKGITMAYSVSMAMITTAGGLVLSIPAMGIYYYLRGRVIRIIADLEEQASIFIELLMEEDTQ